MLGAIERKAFSSQTAQTAIFGQEILARGIVIIRSLPFNFTRKTSREARKPHPYLHRSADIVSAAKAHGGLRDIAMQLEAAWALTNIAGGSSEETQAVAQAGAAAQFIRLLTSPADRVREQV